LKGYIDTCSVDPEFDEVDLSWFANHGVEAVDPTLETARSWTPKNIPPMYGPVTARNWIWHESSKPVKKPTLRAIKQRARNKLLAKKRKERERQREAEQNALMSRSQEYIDTVLSKAFGGYNNIEIEIDHTGLPLVTRTDVNLYVRFIEPYTEQDVKAARRYLFDSEHPEEDSRMNKNQDFNHG